MNKIYSLLYEKQTPAHLSKTEIELKLYNKPAELMKQMEGSNVIHCNVMRKNV